MPRRKHEPYISIDKGRYLTIRIKTTDGVFRRSVNLAEYPTFESAMNVARSIRDKALADRRMNRLATHTHTVEEMYRKTFDLFGYSQKTWKRHEIFYNSAIAPYAHKQVHEITGADVLESATAYAQTHTDDQTNRMLSVWRSIFIASQMSGIDIPDYTEYVRRVRPSSKVPPNERITTVSDDDLQLFLDALLNIGSDYAIMVYTLCMVMLYTGCRPAEALALTVKDIDFKGKTIHIHTSIGSTHSSPGQTVRSTKTGISARYVPMHDDLIAILSEYIEGKDGLLFSIDGKPLEIDKLSDYVARTSRRLGIHFNLYALRHKFSTDMLRITDLRTVKELMGHKSGATTIGYAESNAERKTDAINARNVLGNKKSTCKGR